MIEIFYNTTATNVRRATSTPTGGDVISTVSSFSGLLWPVTEVAKLFVESNIGKEYDFVADNSTDIKVGDDLYISGSKYDVLGVSVFTDLEADVDSYVNIRVVKK